MLRENEHIYLRSCVFLRSLKQIEHVHFNRAVWIFLQTYYHSRLTTTPIDIKDENIFGPTFT